MNDSSNQDESIDRARRAAESWRATLKKRAREFEQRKRRIEESDGQPDGDDPGLRPTPILRPEKPKLTRAELKAKIIRKYGVRLNTAPVLDEDPEISYQRAEPLSLDTSIHSLNALSRDGHETDSDDNTSEPQPAQLDHHFDPDTSETTQERAHQHAFDFADDEPDVSIPTAYPSSRDTSSKASIDVLMANTRSADTQHRVHRDTANPARGLRMGGGELESTNGVAADAVEDMNGSAAMPDTQLSETALADPDQILAHAATLFGESEPHFESSTPESRSPSITRSTPATRDTTPAGSHAPAESDDSSDTIQGRDPALTPVAEPAPASQQTHMQHAAELRPENPSRTTPLAQWDGTSVAEAQNPRPRQVRPIAAAPPSRRLLAYMVDLSLVVVASCLNVSVVARVLGQTPPEQFAEAPVPFSLFALVLALVYLTGFVAASGQTPGLALMDCEITRYGGGRVPLTRALLRSVMLLMGTMTAGLAGISALLDAERRGLPDLLAGTEVLARDRS